MSRIRRRGAKGYSALRKQFSPAALTLSVIALALALAGGAYAAGGLSKAQEKQVTKIAKKYAGKPGATGPAGPAGANGKDGAAGAKGATGSPGSNGESVNVSAYSGEECEEAEGEEGAEFHNGTGAAYACNGKEGSPWTAGGTLPQGKTETGAFTDITNASGKLATALSFPIPLGLPLAFSKVKINPISGASAALTCDVTSGSKVVEACSGGSFLSGSLVSGAGIPAGAYVANKLTNSKFELSEEATASGAAVALTLTPRPIDPECENASHTGAASPENPEAKSGFLCIYLARDGAPLISGGGMATVESEPAALGLNSTLKAGSTGNPGTNFGVSVSGASLPLVNGGVEKEVSGTFAVTG